MAQSAASAQTARFGHYHLLFVLVATPIYLWFELSFGVSLLDAMAGTVMIDDTLAIEHWGRLISGSALALLVIALILKQAEQRRWSWALTLALCVLGYGVSVVVTWQFLAAVLDFYVRNPGPLIPTLSWFMAGMGLIVLFSALATRQMYRRFHWHRGLAVGFFLLVSVGLLIGLLKLLNVPKLDDVERASEISRQNAAARMHTATVTVMRRGVQEGIAHLPGSPINEKIAELPEGKAFLVLMPIFGAVYETERFTQDRARLIEEFMYRDWDESFGATTYRSYQEIAQPLEQSDTKGLNREQINRNPTVVKALQKHLACFDCAFTLGMTRESVGREYFRTTQKQKVTESIEKFSQVVSFSGSKDGDRAARTYWAPLLALLFSMLGAFTHLYKLAATSLKFAVRVKFHRAGQADSPAADAAIAKVNALIAAAVMVLVVAIYFSSNKLTGSAEYLEQRPSLFERHPVAGRAAHWTVNAQARLYPLSQAMRGAWPAFNDDPISYIPFVRDWVKMDYE